MMIKTPSFKDDLKIKRGNKLKITKTKTTKKKRTKWPRAPFMQSIF